MYKMIAAGSMALFAVWAFHPVDAMAGTRIGIGVGVGGGYPGAYDPGYPAYDPGYDEQDDYVSCREGGRILRDSGFYRVRPVRCGGPVYRYEAVRRDRLWSVRVRADSGRIISARPIGYPY